MKIGVFLGTQHPGDADMRRAFQDHLEQTRALRYEGYDAVWVGQHYLTYPEQFFQTTPLLARLAAEAGDMTIGTNLLLLPLHNPVDVAEQYATLDIVADGRFILGVGLGYRQQEYDVFGVERRTRARRFEEALELLKRLWTEDHVTFEGRFFQVKDVSVRPRPLQTPRPPVWIGAAADPAVRRAALLGDAWISTSLTTLAAIKEQVALYRRTRAEAGLPPAAEYAKCVELYVAKDRRRALEESAPYIAAKYRTYYSWGMGKNVPGESGETLSVEDLVVQDLPQLQEQVGIPRALDQFVSITTVPGHPEDPEMTEWRERLQRLFPNDALSVFNLMGIGSGMVVVEALKRAGPDLTRETFLRALGTIKNFKTGMYPGPISCNPPGSHQCNQSVAWIRLVESKVKVIGVTTLE